VAVQPSSPAGGGDREWGLLRFYEEWTGNRARERERQQMCELTERFTDAAIKAGIIRSVLLCRSRVNSLTYCEGAIAEVAGTGVDAGYLEYLIHRYGDHRSGAQPSLPGIGGELSELKTRKTDG
jgi:hypothetical protein